MWTTGEKKSKAESALITSEHCDPKTFLPTYLVGRKKSKLKSMKLNLNSEWYDTAGKPMQQICCFPITYGTVKQNLPLAFPIEGEWIRIISSRTFELKAYFIFQLAVAILCFLFRFFFMNRIKQNLLKPSIQLRWLCFYRTQVSLVRSMGLVVCH